MEYVTVLGTIALIHLLTMIIPGPNFLAVTQISINSTRSRGLATAMGIATGALIWSSSAAFGVSFVFVKFVWLYSVLKWLGGSYIIYLGIRFWLSSNGEHSSRNEIHLPNNFRAYRFGLITNLTNPKSILFFGSIFTTLLQPGLPQWVRVSAVGVILLNAVWWHTTLVLLFSRKRVQKAYTRNKAFVNRSVGALFMVFGIRLLL